MSEFYIYTAHLSKHNTGGITTSSDTGYHVANSKDEVREIVTDRIRMQRASYKVDDITIRHVTLEDLKLAIKKIELK